MRNEGKVVTETPGRKGPGKMQNMRWFIENGLKTFQGLEMLICQ
jgi:hypothetical protein